MGFRKAARPLPSIAVAATLAIAGSISAGTAQALENLRFEIPAVDEDLRDALVDASLILSAKQDGRTSPQDIIAAANADYANLLGVLYKFGYYSGVIRISIDGREAGTLSPFAKPDGVDTVVVTVLPDFIFGFSKTEITPLAPGTELPEEFTPGEPARAAVIGAAADAGIGGWRDQGRAKAEIVGENIVADHRTNTLSAQVMLKPGPVVTFGNLVQTSESDVRSERLRQIAGLPTGTRFDPEELKKSAQRLRRTGAFKSVALTESETLRDGDVMDIQMNIADEKPRRFGAGIEVSSNEGLTVSSFWLHRNLLGGAERLRFDVEVGGIGSQTGGFEGGIDYKVGARFERPATFGADTTLFVLGNIAREDEPNYLSDSAELGFGFSRIINDELTVEAGLGLRYSEERDVTGRSEFFHLLIPLKATYDNRDDPLDPSKGFYAQAEVTPFIALDGKDSGGRILLDGRAYREVTDSGFLTLATRLQFGSVLGASLADTPQEFLFYSGGGNTVRGHPYQSLGVGPPFAITGGRSFVGASAEARFDIAGNFDPVAFFDVGYIGSESLYDDSGRWHSGAGIGIRYATGIGPIRFDVAAPVSGSTGDGVQIYIGIGQAF